MLNGMAEWTEPENVGGPLTSAEPRAKEKKQKEEDN